MKNARQIIIQTPKSYVDESSGLVYVLQLAFYRYVNNKESIFHYSIQYSFIIVEEAKKN